MGRADVDEQGCCLLLKEMCLIRIFRWSTLSVGLYLAAHKARDSFSHLLGTPSRTPRILRESSLSWQAAFSLQRHHKLCEQITFPIVLSFKTLVSVHMHICP